MRKQYDFSKAKKIGKKAAKKGAKRSKAAKKGGGGK